ncbi:ubiquitin carboxyl-terminal hydrolase-domain-containing protein [Podospora appendiculata]|uniref:ubiquitinyl hydrolase 1 n=1 Tax=Podospora appendiculata TaxID=314037 RepID=A0AAE1CAV2_9PEZI|nr:ubiquitin carboxyl-terminal hydrolase-domain-containing protein [Podospora appendiculata]
MEKMKAMPRKFRSVREKNGSHRRNKSSEPGGKPRPLTSESWLSIFKPESTKQAKREKEEIEKDAAKIEEISRRLEELKYTGITHELIRYALNSKFANGDVEKGMELVQLQQQAFAGIIQPYNPNIQMLGAENRGGVTCYLDALLFAMFSKLSAFECMLKNDNTDENQRKLAALIRLWVNMLRSGKLIHTDMTQHIQESLAACGWQDAQLLEQQDTSEAFAFITETLQLPLLTLRVDLYHQGMRDDDDHKVVHERLLNLAIPSVPEGKVIKLEDCLEEYFNNQVDVLRESQEDTKANEKGALSRTTTLATTNENEAIPNEDDEATPLQRRWTVQNSVVESPVSMTYPSSAKSFETLSVSRHRSTSIIQRIVVSNDGHAPEPVPEAETETILERAKRTGSTVIKAVTIPAWQFFRLIPWHSTSNGEPNSNVEVARHFNQRPVVGICLKRYTMTDKGVPIRQNTLIDIPDSLRLPHFMALDDPDPDQESDGLSQEYKLVLQSVICHRGDSLHSGHYVAFARVAPKLLTDNRRHDSDPPPDYEEAQWAKFDDLAHTRVTYVDDIKQSLREEMPYVLFYQIVPMVDVTTTSTDGSVVADPPSYDEVTIIPGTPISDTAQEQGVGISRSASGYFESCTTLLNSSSGGPSIRFSNDFDRPARISFDEESNSATPSRVNEDSRRGSVALSETAATGPAATSVVTPENAPLPTVTPQDESTAARLSRAAQKFTKTGSKSRPTSQAGEGRISFTMTRLGFARPSKDPLNAPGSTAAQSAPVSIEHLDEQAVIVEEEDAAPKEKEHHHHHLHYKKDRTKSKSKGKDKDKNGEKDASVPDRECIVM